MKKNILPWLIAAACAAGFLVEYRASQSRTARIATLEKSAAEVETLQDEITRLKKDGSPAQAAEITNMLREKSDVNKLRNEAATLRADKAQLTRQLQAAMSALTGTQKKQEEVLQQIQSENEQLRSVAEMALRAQQTPTATSQDPAATCVTQLHMIDIAKQAWAQDRQKAVTAVPTERDLTPYFNGGLPVCPAGGKYSLNAVGEPATCSIAAHAPER